MNPITEEILTALLKDKNAWNWKGRGVKRHIVGRKDDWINNQYARAHEYLWVERIYLAKQFRAYHLFKLFATATRGEDNDYVQTHFGQCWLNDQELVETIECDDCLHELQSMLSDSNWTYPQPCFIDWWFWEHPEWEQENITKELLDTINVTPEVSHQQTLF